MGLCHCGNNRWILVAGVTNGVRIPKFVARIHYRNTTSCQCSGDHSPRAATQWLCLVSSRRAVPSRSAPRRSATNLPAPSPISVPCTVIRHRTRAKPAWKHFSRPQNNPSKRLYADFSFRQTIVACDSALTILRFKFRLTSAPSPAHAHHAAFRFLLLCFRSPMYFC